MANGMDDFLGNPPAARQDAAPEPPPEPQQTAAPVEQEPVETEAHAPEPEGAEGDAALEAGDAGDEPEGGAEQNKGGSAFAALRRQNRDHKGRADRAEGELQALRAERERETTERAEQARQLAEMRQAVEDMRRQAVPAAPQPPPEPEVIPNPIEDPQGYHNYQQEQLFIARLDMSEAILRQQVGDDDVQAKVEVFKKAAEANPALGQQLRREKHPWGWMYNQAKRMQMMDEMGDDPSAYRSKIETEMRAKVEADVRAQIKAEVEAQQTEALASVPGIPPVPQRVVALPTSLSTARSAAPRDAPAWTGPDDLDDIVRGRARR